VVADPYSGGASGACVSGKIGTCFPGNIIPASRIDPIAKQVMAYYPLPNRPGQANNLYVVSNDPDYWDSFVAKLDQRVRSSDSFSFRFLKRFNRNTAPYNGSPVGGFGYAENNRQSLAGISYTRLFSPTLINETRFGVSRTATRQIGEKQGRDYAAEWGLKASTSDPDMVGFPRFTVTNMAALGLAANMPVVFHVTNYQISNTLTWVKGKHVLKFGGELLRTQFFQPYYNNNRGTFNFNGFWTSVPSADLLLGTLNQVTRTEGTNPNYLFFNNWGFFAQDDVRITSTLTLSVGLRYELPMPPHEKYGRMTNLVPELGVLAIASDRTVPNLNQLIADGGLTGKAALAKDLGLPDSLMEPYYRSLAPRFGFAWRPFGGTKSVLRGGYGVFYGTNLWNPVRNDLANVYPFSINYTQNRNTTRPELLTLQNPLGIRGNLNGVLTPNGFQVKPTPQYLQSWNLTVERWRSGMSARKELTLVESTTSTNRSACRACEWEPLFRGPSPASTTSITIASEVTRVTSPGCSLFASAPPAACSTGSITCTASRLTGRRRSPTPRTAASGSRRIRGACAASADAPTGIAATA
jgi:hypothetical protein